MQENYEYVQKGFHTLLPVMSGYIGQEFNRVYGSNWWQEVLEALSDQMGNLPEEGSYGDLVDSLDVANCLRLIDRRWKEVFRTKLPLDCRNWAKELMGVRNKVAHIGSEDMKQHDAERALDTMALLCEYFDPESTEGIRKYYRIVRYGSEEGSVAADTKKVSAKMEASARSEGVLSKSAGVKGNLPSWRKIMQPHPDVAEGRYRQAEFAADLAQVARGEGAIEYRDPVEFFSRTYITEGMQGLLVEALQRITGKGGEPVIQLKTAFGGGKTHSMLALYHMVRGTVKIDRLPSLKPILDRAGLTELPKANVAVLVGTAMNPSKKKTPPNFPGYSISTIWGEMAFQLVTSAGNPKLYEIVRDADRKGVSPGSESLKELFDACGPCVILMDELVAYARKLYGVEGLPAGSFDNFITFIQEITEAARASENSIVVASIPESDREIGGDAGKIALEAIEHTFGRMESVWKPVTANEGFEVVRRRLFLPCQNEAAREDVCEVFSRMYQENDADFPTETKELDYKKRMISCYPIHPEVFDRLYNEWATLEKFQRTRGVLRLMSAVIHVLWMNNDSSAMIMPGSIPLDAPEVKDELIRNLEESDAWNTIIDKEVDGRSSIPYQKDKEIPRYGQKMASRRVARTILLGSAPSTREQNVRGLERDYIRLGVIQPGESIADFNDALNTLQDSMSYLYNSGNRFWLDTRPTLRKMAEDRATQISLPEIDEEIERRIRKIRKEKPFGGVHTCPASSQDVPDEQDVRLVLLGTNATYNNKKGEDAEAVKAAAEILNSHGSSFRKYRNMLIFLAPDSKNLDLLRNEVRKYLAWWTIQEDKENLNLDESQRNEVKKNIQRSDETIEMRIKETWCWLIVPYIDLNIDLQTIFWDISNIGRGSESIVKNAVKKLENDEQIITYWAPISLQICLNDILWKDRDSLQIKTLWDYLSTYCYLPRLANYSVLEQAVLKGLDSDEFFAIAAGYENDRYVNLRLGKPVFSINKTDLLVKPDAARKQLYNEMMTKKDHSSESQTANNGEVSETDFYPVDGKENAKENLNTDKDSTPPSSNTLHHFYMRADLDYIRVNKKVSEYIDEIVQHLADLEGSEVKLELNVEVDVPKGISSDVVMIVSENCKTENIDDYGFDE